MYEYLAIEILIWIIFALGFNLLLGLHRTALVRSRRLLRHRRVRLRARPVQCLAESLVLPARRRGRDHWRSVLSPPLFLSHRRGIYFALMTIAFGQIYFFIASKWTSVTGGEDGLLNIQAAPRGPGRRGAVDKAAT